jgi:hypothetical protein
VIVIIAVDFRHPDLLASSLVARIDEYRAARGPRLGQSSIDAATTTEVLDVEPVDRQWSAGRTDIAALSPSTSWVRQCQHGKKQAR